MLPLKLLYFFVLVQLLFICLSSVPPVTYSIKRATASKKQDEDLEGLFPIDDSLEVSGCYIRNIQQLGLKSRRMVPLKNIDYQIEIVNSLAHITLEQEYQNPSNQFITIYYSFPLRPESSIYKFQATFDNITVSGVVKQKEKARQEFQKAKKQGRQGALVNLNQNSKDIVNLEIGNIPPKKKVKITVSFIQEMTLSLNTFYQINIPSSISPRYMNFVPFQNLLNYNQKTQFNIKKLPARYTWNFVIKIRSSKSIVFYYSPSHKLIQTKSSEDKKQIVCTLPRQTIPNRDFKFIYTIKDFELPTYVVGKSDKSTTVLASFIPKFSKIKVDEAYNKYINNSTTMQFEIDTVKGEYIFILDRSGSMEGLRMQRAKQALVIFLKSLPPNSYFNIISFGWSFTKMFPESIRYENEKIVEAISNIQKMDADLGGTQIFFPLQNALNGQKLAGYPKFVFLLTDGSVENTEGVIAMARLKSNGIKISSIGIGNGASSRLIEGTAQAGKGSFVMISDEENPSEKIISLLQSSLTPSITKFKLILDENEVQSIIPNPKKIHSILKDEVVNFYITYKGELRQKKKIEFQYEDSTSKLSFNSQIDIDPSGYNFPFIDKMAHFKIIRKMQNMIKDNIADSQNYFMLNQEIDNYEKEIIKYSVKYQILSEFTSFIALGKQLVDQQKNQFKQIGYKVFQIQQTLPKEYQLTERFDNVQFAKAPPKQAPIPMAAAMALPVLHLNPVFQSIAIQQSFLEQNKPEPIPEEPPIQQPIEVPEAIPQNFVEQKAVEPKASSSIEQSVEELPIFESQVFPSVMPPASKQENKKQEPQINSVPQKIQKQKHKQEFELTIQNLVKIQNFDGSWGEEQIIPKLAKDIEIANNLIQKIKKPNIVITKLAILWIEKQKSKQYSLIIRKAQSWLSRALIERGLLPNDLKDLQVI